MAFTNGLPGVTLSAAQISFKSVLTMRLVDQDTKGVFGSQPLKNLPFSGISFNLNGVSKTLQSNAIDAAVTYPDLLKALNASLAQAAVFDSSLAGITAALGNYFTVTSFDGRPLSGQELTLTSYDDVFNVGPYSGFLSSGGVPANSNFYTSMSVSASVSDGNDVLRGGSGVDTIFFSGPIADYRISYDPAAGTATVTDTKLGRDGTDVLISIEKLQFGFKTFDLLNLKSAETPKFGKSDSFLFDAAYYLLTHPDLVPNVTLATAYDSYKATEGQGAAPASWFDPAYYANRWGDLKYLDLDAATLFAHYNLYGVWEGRSAGPRFDAFDGNAYLYANPDVSAYVDAHVADFLGSRSNGAIAHYVIYGANEGRVAHDTSGMVIPVGFSIDAASAGIFG